MQAMRALGLPRPIVFLLAFVICAGQRVSAESDEIWRPNPNETYGPSTYCQWNRTGLPPMQQKICLDRDRANPPKLYQPKPGEILTKLLPECQVGGAISCNDDLFQPVWKRLEAANGEAIKIDMNSIQHFNNGAVEVVVYTYVPNTVFDIARLKRLRFDCHGQFMELDGGFVSDAPPRSVAGEIADIVCAGAKAQLPRDEGRR
jgi:hypothetical protein